MTTEEKPDVDVMAWVWIVGIIVIIVCIVYVGVAGGDHPSGGSPTPHTTSTLNVTPPDNAKEDCAAFAQEYGNGVASDEDFMYRFCGAGQNLLDEGDQSIIDRNN